jgi:hypothetical protein
MDVRPGHHVPTRVTAAACAGEPRTYQTGPLRLLKDGVAEILYIWHGVQDWR